MSSCHLEWFPKLTLISLAIGLIVSYIWAVLEGHISPYLMYISEGGAFSPEGGFFSLSLYFTAIMGAVTGAIRFRLVSTLNKKTDRKIHIVNIASIFVALIEASGMAIVAAYPMSTISLAHTIGALMCFWGGLLYMTLQTALSYLMFPNFNGVTICRIRLFITIVGFLFLILQMAVEPIGRGQWADIYGETESYHRSPGDAGFLLFEISAIGEWGIGLSIGFFFLTFTKEFQKIRVNISIIPLVSHLDQEVILEVDERSRLIFL